MPLFSCKGTVASSFVNGEADISVEVDNVAVTTLLDATRISWADVINIQFADYTAYIQTKTMNYMFTKLGLQGEPFYNHLLSAYGDKVRKCLFVRGIPDVKAAGDVLIKDISAQALRGVPVEVYENSIISLPPDLSARRVPLCFVTGFSEQDFSITLTTLDGKETVYSKLGYENAPVLKAIQDNIRTLRAKLTDQIMMIDPSLSGEQASALTRLMPGGLAAPLAQIRSISASFAATLEENIAKSRAADTYKYFQEISGADAVCIGFKPDWGFFGNNDEKGTEENPETQENPDENPDENPGESPDETPGFMLWLAVPSPAGDSCAVEFAGADNESAATFIYRFGGTWDSFRIKLGMALEAIDWKREVIRLTDEELKKPEYELYRMANDRNEALRFVRSSFAGRGIHRSFESWKSQVSGFMNL